MPNVYEKEEVKERWYVCTCFIISLIEMNHNSFAFGFDKVRTICIEQHFWRWPNSRIECNLPLMQQGVRLYIYRWWARIKPRGTVIRLTLINDPIESTGSLLSSTFLFYFIRWESGRLLGIHTICVQHLICFWNSDLLHINIDYLLFSIFVIFDDWTWCKTKLTRSMKIHIYIS